MNTFKKAAQKRLKQQSSSLKTNLTTSASSDTPSDEVLSELNDMIEELEQQPLTSEYRRRLLEKMDALQAKQRQFFQKQLPPGPYN